MLATASRRVRFDDEDLDAVRMMIRLAANEPSALLQPGTQIEVEVGARWTKDGRVGGQWVPCVVVSETSKELVVHLKLSAFSPIAAPA